MDKPQYPQQSQQPQQPQYAQQQYPQQPQAQAPYQQQYVQPQYTQPQYAQPQYAQQQNQYPSKGNKKQKTRKKSGIIFWFLFIPIALIMVLLLYGSDASLKTCFLSALVSIVAVVIHKIMRRGWIANLLLCIATIIVLFSIYAYSDDSVNTSKDTDSSIAPYELKVENAVSYPVDPNSEPTVINHMDLKIALPAGITDEKIQLTISNVSNAPAAIEHLTPLCPPMDIELGDKHTFDDPITVSIPYDSSLTGELPLENAFTAVYFNEAEGMWEDVPYEVDEQAGVVNLMLYHLSTVQCYYSYYEGAKIFDDGNSMVIYPIDQSYRELYRKYSDVTVNYSGNEVPQLVIDISEMTKDCICAYRDMGFAMNGKPKIYITPDNTSSKYNSSTGNVSITLSSVSFTDPKTMFMRNVGHELFHKAQAETLGWRVYEATRVRQMSFWLEASADYMGNAAVWKAIGKQQPNQFEIMEKEFFDTSLYTTADPEHQYDAANFANFAMQQNPNVTPMDLVMMANDYSASFDMKFDQYFRTDKYPMLLSYYDAFLNYVLFEAPSTSVAETSNKMIRGSVKETSKVVLKDNGSGVMTTEGGFEIKIPAPYSAGFHVLSTTEDITLELAADSPVSVCVMPEIGKRTVSNRVELAAGVPGSVQVKKNEFVLLFSTSSSEKTAKVIYKATSADLPQPEKEQENASGDFVGLWYVTNMTVNDIIASDAYWSDVAAVTQGKGKSESIADGNEMFKNITRYILIVESEDDPGQLILKMGPSMTISRDTMLQPILVQIDGNKLIAVGYNLPEGVPSRELMEFEMTLENGKLSGTCEATVNADAGSPTTKYGNVTNIYNIEASVDKASKDILADYRQWIKDN